MRFVSESEQATSESSGKSFASTEDGRSTHEMQQLRPRASRRRNGTAFRRPDAVLDVPAQDRPIRVEEDADRATIDGKRFFLRGTLPLPVRERGSDYAIGIWVEVAPQAFRRVVELWTSEDQADEPPFSATLANQIPSLPPTLGLHVAVRLTGPTTRPEFHVLAAEHPIYREQTAGITLHRIHEYNALFA